MSTFSHGMFFIVFSREKDMNDFLFELTATLKLGPVSTNSVPESDFDPNELTNSSNDSDRTIVSNGDSHSPSDEQSRISSRMNHTYSLRHD